MIFDVETSQSNTTANNNPIAAQQALLQQQQQQIPQALMQQLPGNANMFYAIQSAALLNYHLQQQQQQQQSKLNRLQQIQQQQLMLSQNAQNPYFLDLLARNSETLNRTNNNTKIPEQLLKAQQFQTRYMNTNNQLTSMESKNIEETVKMQKENGEFSAIKFYKEVEQTTNGKFYQDNLKTNTLNENSKFDDSIKFLTKVSSPLSGSKRPLLKFGMDSILGNNSSSSNASSVQSTPSVSPCKKRIYLNKKRILNFKSFFFLLI